MSKEKEIYPTKGTDGGILWNQTDGSVGQNFREILAQELCNEVRFFHSVGFGRATDDQRKTYVVKAGEKANEYFSKGVGIATAALVALIFPPAAPATASATYVAVQQKAEDAGKAIGEIAGKIIGEYGINQLNFYEKLKDFALDINVTELEETIAPQFAQGVWEVYQRQISQLDGTGSLTTLAHYCAARALVYMVMQGKEWTAEAQKNAEHLVLGAQRGISGGRWRRNLPAMLAANEWSNHKLKTKPIFKDGMEGETDTGLHYWTVEGLLDGALIRDRATGNMCYRGDTANAKLYKGIPKYGYRDASEIEQREINKQHAANKALRASNKNYDQVKKQLGGSYFKTLSVSSDFTRVFPDWYEFDGVKGRIFIEVHSAKIVEDYAVYCQERLARGEKRPSFERYAITLAYHKKGKDLNQWLGSEEAIEGDFMIRLNEADAIVLDKFPRRSKHRLIAFNISFADGLVLSNLNLAHTNLNAVDISKAIFEKTDLSYASLIRTTATQTDFTGAILRGAKLHAIEATKAQFVYSDMSNADIAAGRFYGANFSHTKLQNVSFIAAKLEHALHLDEADTSYDLDAELAKMKKKLAKELTERLREELSINIVNSERVPMNERISRQTLQVVKRAFRSKPFVCIHGDAATGKTELLKDYVATNDAFFKYTFDASSTYKLYEQLCGFAHDIGHDISSILQTKEGVMNSVVPMIHEKLRDLSSQQKKWLLSFDNVSEEAGERDMLKNLFSGLMIDGQWGQIAVSSRNAIDDFANYELCAKRDREKVKETYLSDAEAIDLFKRTSQGAVVDIQERQAFLEVAKESPLAIKIGGAIVKKDGAEALERVNASLRYYGGLDKDQGRDVVVSKNMVRVALNHAADPSLSQELLMVVSCCDISQFSTDKFLFNYYQISRDADESLTFNYQEFVQSFYELRRLDLVGSVCADSPSVNGRSDHFIHPVTRDYMLENYQLDNRQQFFENIYKAIAASMGFKNWGTNLRTLNSAGYSHLLHCDKITGIENTANNMLPASEKHQDDNDEQLPLGQARFPIENTDAIRILRARITAFHGNALLQKHKLYGPAKEEFQKAKSIIEGMFPEEEDRRIFREALSSSGDAQLDAVGELFVILHDKDISLPSVYSNIMHFLTKAAFHTTKIDLKNEAESLGNVIADEELSAGAARATGRYHECCCIMRDLIDDIRSRKNKVLTPNQINDLDAGDVFNDGDAVYTAHTVMFKRTLGMSYISEGKLEKAEEMLNNTKVMQDDFNKAQSLDNLSHVQMLRQKFNEAEATLREAEALGGNAPRGEPKKLRNRYRNRLGHVLLELGKDEEAKEKFEEVLENCDRFRTSFKSDFRFDANAGLGKFYYKQYLKDSNEDNLSEAKEHYRIAANIASFRGEANTVFRFQEVEQNLKELKSLKLSSATSVSAGATSSSNIAALSKGTVVQSDRRKKQKANVSTNNLPSNQKKKHRKGERSGPGS